MRGEKYIWTDEKIVIGICGTPNERDAALYYFFSDEKLFNTVKQYIQTWGGQDKDCEDVFQEVFILFEYNIRQRKYRGESNLRTYFMGIVKLYWLSEQRKKKEVVEYDTQLHDVEISSIEMEIISDEERHILNETLTKLGEKCKELILLTGITDSHLEIATIMGFSSPEMARKEVFRCRKRFRQFISEHPYLESVLKSIIRK